MLWLIRHMGEVEALLFDSHVNEEKLVKFIEDCKAERAYEAAMIAALKLTKIRKDKEV